SAMERPDRIITLHSREGIDGVPPKIALPPNLVVVGTVNIDETVQPFSDKVKDRANTIVVPIDLASYAELVRNGTPPETSALKSKAFAYARTEEGGRALRILSELYSTLAPQQLHFGYRIVDEILAYLGANAELGLLAFDEAMDLQVDQKILPRIR